MNLKKTLKKITISMLLAVASIPVHGQDLLARQAPVDRKMAAVDTIMLRNIAAREEAESPATDLYAGWDNRYAHRLLGKLVRTVPRRDVQAPCPLHCGVLHDGSCGLW